MFIMVEKINEFIFVFKILLHYYSRLMVFCVIAIHIMLLRFSLSVFILVTYF